MRIERENGLGSSDLLLKMDVKDAFQRMHIAWDKASGASCQKQNVSSIFFFDLLAMVIAACAVVIVVQDRPRKGGRSCDVEDC